MFRDETDQGNVFFPDALVLPYAARLDAFKVYCDEGYHSLYSLDLAVQAAEVTGVPIPSWDYGGFVDRLQHTGARMLPDHPNLVPLLQVVTFETLITAVLNEVPADETVVTVVRDIARDHARDEGQHHRFFSGFFHELWNGLDEPTRGPVAHALPALIVSCLQWDLGPVAWSLELAGLDRPVAAQVVEDCYGGAGDAARMREICQATVRMCRSAGVFDVAGAPEAFAARGLIA